VRVWPTHDSSSSGSSSSSNSSIFIFMAAVTEAAPLKGDAVVIGAQPKAWKAPCCTCFSDCCICCSVVCCTSITSGQIYEKAVRAGLLSRAGPLGCMGIFLILLGLYIANSILVSSDPSYYEKLTDLVNGPEVDATPPAAVQIGQVCMLAAFLISCLITCSVRKAIRKRDAIPASCCADYCDDCFCTWCCLPCMQCQILQHEGVTGSKYSLCSPIAVKV